MQWWERDKFKEAKRILLSKKELTKELEQADIAELETALNLIKQLIEDKNASKQLKRPVAPQVNSAISIQAAMAKAGISADDLKW